MYKIYALFPQIYSGYYEDIRWIKIPSPVLLMDNLFFYLWGDWNMSVVTTMKVMMLLLMMIMMVLAMLYKEHFRMSCLKRIVFLYKLREIDRSAVSGLQ